MFVFKLGTFEPEAQAVKGEKEEQANASSILKTLNEYEMNTLNGLKVDNVRETLVKKTG